ncbi:unnamed protein product [Pleuronectes platessa]|uniref:Uncharacterized protein n=1 Tax=Pleuronectes platessa TaxID=8262 RepID=A0A9N7VC99_PLEPL|nr:unnamed protein product [Pleuronectes platessa]
MAADCEKMGLHVGEPQHVDQESHYHPVCLKRDNVGSLPKASDERFWPGAPNTSRPCELLDDRVGGVISAKGSRIQAWKVCKRLNGAYVHHQPWVLEVQRFRAESKAVQVWLRSDKGERKEERSGRRKEVMGGR